jgi:hypothetical protein
MKISDGGYKDVPAQKVETEKFTALFLPEYGGKFASLKDRRMGREFLSQAAGNGYKKLSYAGDYVAAECSGFDDMFPTIDRCYYDRYPWNGVELPDHGEVCGLKWLYREEDGRLHMWTDSPRFGYRFEKWVSEVEPSLPRSSAGVPGEGAIRIDYRVTNKTQFEFDFVYAAHCMIAVEEGGRVLLPSVPDGEKAALVFASDPKRGRYGDPFIWHKDEPGVSVTPGPNAGEAFKFFFDAPQREGNCGYLYPDGTLLTIDYSGEKLPYLGLWLNWNEFHGFCNAAFEPSSGSFDRPDAARIRGQFSVLPPYGEYEWTIGFDLKE